MKSVIKAICILLSTIMICGTVPTAGVSVPSGTYALAVSGSRFKEVYDATEAALAGSVIGTSLDDYSGQGYIDGLPGGASATFTVDCMVQANVPTRQLHRRSPLLRLRPTYKTEWLG